MAFLDLVSNPIESGSDYEPDSSTDILYAWLNGYSELMNYTVQSQLKNK